MIPGNRATALGCLVALCAVTALPVCAVDITNESITGRRTFPGATSVVVRDSQLIEQADLALTASQFVLLTGESVMRDESHIGLGRFLSRAWLLRSGETPDDLLLSRMWANGANAGAGLRAERRIVVTSSTAAQIVLRGTPGAELILATTGQLSLMPGHQRSDVIRVGSDGRAVIASEVAFPQARGALIAQDRATSQRVVVEVSRE